MPKLTIEGIEVPVSDNVLYATEEASREYINAINMNKPTFETVPVTFESDKWKEKLQGFYFVEYPDVDEFTRDLDIFVSNLLAEQKKDILQNPQKTDISDKHISSHTNQLIEEKWIEQFETKFSERPAWLDELRGNAQRFNFLRNFINTLLSQTEQKCDKKWRRKLENRRDVEAENYVGDGNYSEYSKGRLNALDDLLKQ